MMVISDDHVTDCVTRTIWPLLIIITVSYCLQRALSMVSLLSQKERRRDTHPGWPQLSTTQPWRHLATSSTVSPQHKHFQGLVTIFYCWISFWCFGRMSVPFSWLVCSLDEEGFDEVIRKHLEFWSTPSSEDNHKKTSSTVMIAIMDSTATGAELKNWNKKERVVAVNTKHNFPEASFVPTSDIRPGLQL